MVRVGIDLDKPSILTRLFAYHNLNSVNFNGNAHEIRIFISTSGKGFHLELIGVKPNLELRRACRDDVKRITISESRQHLGARWDVLFHEKRSDFRKDKAWKKREPITISQFLPMPFTIVKQLFFKNRREGILTKPKQRKLKRNKKWRGRL